MRYVLDPVIGTATRTARGAIPTNIKLVSTSATRMVRNQMKGRAHSARSALIRNVRCPLARKVATKTAIASVCRVPRPRRPRRHHLHRRHHRRHRHHRLRLGGDGAGALALPELGRERRPDRSFRQRAARGRAQRKAPGRAGVQGAEPLGRHGELEEAHRISRKWTLLCPHRPRCGSCRTQPCVIPFVTRSSHHTLSRTLTRTTP